MGSALSQLNRGGRFNRRRRGFVMNNEPINDPVSDDDDDLQADVGNEPNLASILSLLLRSGQLRLSRPGHSGAFQVTLNSRSPDSDESDGEDITESFFHSRSLVPPSPSADAVPDDSNIKDNEIQGIVKKSRGDDVIKPKNMCQRICARENMTLKKRNHFTIGDQINNTRTYLPNKVETVARYNSKVFCGVYSTLGDVFMSACQDQHIRLYDTTNGQFKLFHDIHARDVGWSVVDVAYSPDQNYIIYSSWSEAIHLCNVYGNHETHLSLDLRPTDSRFCAFSVCFSQDSKEILAGASDQCLYIYDRGSDYRTLRIEGHDDDVNAVAFADDSSQILLSGGDDGLCKIWDRRELSEAKPKPVGIMAGHTNGIAYICPKNDGKYFISNSKDQTIKLWDMRRMSSEETVREARKIVANQRWDYRWEPVPRRSRRLKTVPGNDAVMTYSGHSVIQTLLRARFSPAFSTGQQYIYTGCASGAVVVYDVLTGKIVKKLKGHHRQVVRDVSWHPYDNVIMSSSWDASLGKWQYSREAEEGFSCDSQSHGSGSGCDDKDKDNRRFKRRRQNFFATADEIDYL